MLRNQYFKASLNLNNKIKNLDKEKYDSTSTNILNEYKKLKESDCFNSDIKLSNTASIYTKNIFNNNRKTPIDGVASTQKYYKKKINNNFYIHNKSRPKSIQINSNISNKIIDAKNDNKNIIPNDDTDHNSSMETIKNILYNTEINDEHKEVKNNNITNDDKNNKKLPGLFKSTKIEEMPDEKVLFPNHFKKINIRRNERNISPLFKTDDNDSIQNENIRESKNIRKNIYNKINKNLTFHTKYGTLNSMKIIANNNNYDYDNDIFDIKYNTINDDFKKISEEKDDLLISNDRIPYLKSRINSNNNNYRVRKINNNINININNNNNNKIDNQINNINYTSRFTNIDNDSIFCMKDQNNLNFDNCVYLKQKIKELTEEINNKNILINEYSTLAKQSKSKFEQLIEHNKKRISEMEEEAKKQNNILNLKINNLEKEKQDLLKKEKENQKYISFLEMLLFDDNKNNNINDKKDENCDKNFEEILQIKVNDIKKLQKELENKNEENEKLKNIIIKIKKNQTFRADRAVSNPRKNIIEIENKIKKELKSDNNNKNGNNKKKMHISLNQNIGCKNLLNGLNLNDHSKNE